VTRDDDDLDLDLEVTSWKATVALVSIVVVVLGLFIVLRPDGSPEPDADDPTLGGPTVPAGPTTTSPGGTSGPGDPGDPDGVESGLPSETTRPTPGTSPVCVEEREDADLRVLVFNIKAGRVGGLERVARVIEASRADVVLLQEVDQLAGRTGRVDQPSALGNRLRMAWGFGRNIRLAGGSYGTAIMSRYPLTDLTNIALPNVRGEEQRGLLHATITVDDVTISLYTTHLEAGRVSDLRQRQMRRIAEVVRADDNPVILGGDLNASSGSPELAIARSVLVDTWATVGTGNGNTVPARSPRGRIDYVFHSADKVTPVQSVVLPDVVSDHRAILSDYVVPGVETRTCVDLPQGPLDPP
jgi:endonuclease/exonuclease/phosphatase family metal-dependent hydrolase